VDKSLRKRKEILIVIKFH